jgi:hypothetical protein
MKDIIEEIVISLVIMTTLFFVVNPLDIFMPSDIQMIFVAIFGVALITFLVFLTRIKTIDERDEYHQSIAGKYSYLFSVLVASIIFIWQALTYQLDYTIVLLLLAMIFSNSFILILLRIFK